MSRGVASRAVRAWTLLLVAALLVSGLSSVALGATADVEPAAQCGFADGERDPTVATQRHDFGEVVVGRAETRTVGDDGAGTVEGNAEPAVIVGGPDAGQFRARAVSETTTGERTLQVSFAPTAPGPKRAWVVVSDDATTVHCLVGTAVVAGASKGGSESDGAGGSRDSDGRGASGAAAGSAGSGGGKVTDAVRGFGREFVGSVTRGVVSVVTLEFARDAAVGAGAAWAAGDGVVGKTLNVAGYTLSGIDPTAGLRNGLPAALAAWRAGDFEGAGRALFGVVESVVFTGAAAAGAWEGSKRARQFTHDRREATSRPTTGGDRPGVPSTTDYRTFTAGIDAALSSGLGDETREDGGETSVRGDGPTVVDDGVAEWGTSNEGALPGHETSVSSDASDPSNASGDEGRGGTDGADHGRDRELA